MSNQYDLLKKQQELTLKMSEDITLLSAELTACKKALSESRSDNQRLRDEIAGLDMFVAWMNLIIKDIPECLAKVYIRERLALVSKEAK